MLHRNSHHVMFAAADTEEAQALCQKFVAKYAQASSSQATVLVAIGGDGFMLQALHDYQHLKLPVYGVNCGSVGFLMNEPDVPNLHEKLQHSESATIFPLHMTAQTIDGKIHHGFAINEISLFRESPQAAKIQIHIDGIKRLDTLVCDGVMVATPAGSTAYNLSVHGPIIPVGAKLLALTPISPFRPRRWRGALLPDAARVTFDVLEPKKRPVSVAADDRQVRHVVKVDVIQDHKNPYILLFDPDHNLENRILREQFLS